MARRMPPEFFLTGSVRSISKPLVVLQEGKKINFNPHPVCSAVSLGARIHRVSFAYKTGIFWTRQPSMLNLCDNGLQD